MEHHERGYDDREATRVHNPGCRLQILSDYHLTLANEQSLPRHDLAVLRVGCVDCTSWLHGEACAGYSTGVFKYRGSGGTIGIVGTT